jgi:hypothetical protein
MYSEKLETMIKSVIADGWFSLKEREVLHRLAEQEGVDADEIDVYVEGLLSEMQNDKKSKQKHQNNDVDLSLFVKEVSNDYMRPVYYRLKRTFLQENLDYGKYGVQNFQISFIDTVHFNQENYHEWARSSRIGLGLLLSTSSHKSFWYYRIEFLADGKELLTLEGDSSYWHSFLDQNINGELAKTCAYKIDEEQLKVLCDAHNITIRYNDKTTPEYNHIELNNIPLPGFEYYCQYFYNLRVDKTAYQDAGKLEEQFLIESAEASEKEEKNRMSRKEKEQKYAGLLSGPFKIFKKIAPTPNYIKQFLHERDNVIISHAEGKLFFKKKDGDKEKNGYLSLHSLTPNGEKPIFYLGMTFTDGYRKLEDCSILKLIVDFENKLLSPVTTDKEHLNKKSKYHGDSFNFFECPNEVLQQILQTKNDITIEISLYDKYTYNYVTKKTIMGRPITKGLEKLLSIFGIMSSPIPTDWKDAYKAITDETVLENWRKERNK